MGVIARQSIRGAMANYAGVAIGFVVTFFVLTRVLTEEEVGLTRVLVDAAMLLSSVAQVGTSSWLVRFFPHVKDSKDGHGIFGLALLVPLVGWLVVCGLVLALRGVVVDWYAERSPLMADYLAVVPMLTMAMLYMTVMETCSSVLMRIAVPKAVREVGVRLFNLGAYVLYGLGVVGLDGFVWLFCGSYALAMVVDVVYVLKVTGWNVRMFKVDWTYFTPERRREMGRYALLMTMAVLAGNTPLLSSLFLGAKAGAALTGVFAIGSYIANVVEVPYRSLGAISRPVVATAVKEGNWGEVNRLAQQVSLHQLLVSLVIFFLIWTNLETLYAFIPNGDRYAGGAVVVLLLGMAKVLNSSMSIGIDVLGYSPLYSRSLPLNLLLTTTAIVLNACLIGPLGIGGAALGSLLAYMLFYAVLLGYEWRRLGVSLFSSAQLKVLVLLVAAFALDALWRNLLSPLLGGGRWVLLADSVLRTVVLGGGLTAAVLGWRVSETLNGMARKITMRG